MNSITLGRPGLLVHHELVDADLGSVLRILVQALLVRPHPELPLEVLRDRHIGRMAHQQDRPPVVEVAAVVEVAGIVAQVVVVGEEDPRDAGVLAAQIVEADQSRGGEPEAELEEAGHQHPHPGAAGLAEGDHDTVGKPELAQLLAAALAALDGPAPLGRHPEGGQQHKLAREPLPEIVEHVSGSRAKEGSTYINRVPKRQRQPCPRCDRGPRCRPARARIRVATGASSSSRPVDGGRKGSPSGTARPRR